MNWTNHRPADLHRLPFTSPPLLPTLPAPPAKKWINGSHGPTILTNPGIPGFFYWLLKQDPPPRRKWSRFRIDERRRLPRRIPPVKMPEERRGHISPDLLRPDHQPGKRLPVAICADQQLAPAP